MPFASPAAVSLVFRRAWACAALLLFAATWRLWGPQTAYPQIPLVAWGRTIPSAVDGLLRGILVAALLLVVWGPARRVANSALLTFAFTCSVLILLDQHRLQPWAWQFVVTAVVLARLAPAESLKWLRILTIGIYFHSAVSKLDFSFVHGLGGLFLTTSLGFAGVSPADWPEPLQVAAVLAFPLGELLIAGGLCLRRPRWRRGALLAASLMHVVMLAVLGPWGLRHQPPVLLWNGWFLVQNWLLFTPAQDVVSSPEPAGVPQTPAPRGLFARLLIAGAVLLPFVEPWGAYDHWPAWGLYASHVERVELWLDESLGPRLPQSVQRYLRLDHHPFHRLQCRLDRWSLGELQAPIYPQARFQVGVVLDFVDRFQIPDGSFLAVVEGPADRRTGRRTHAEFTTRAQLERLANRYQFNARPRSAAAK